MPIVPTEATLLDRLIEAEDKLRRAVSGCGGSTGDENDPEDGGEIPPDDPEDDPDGPEVPEGGEEEEVPIIPRASCKKKKDGSGPKYPAGTPWPFADPFEYPGNGGTLRGKDIVEGAVGQVQVNATFYWWPLGSGSRNSTRVVGFPRSLMFKLPPGWWPQKKETFAVPVEGGNGHVEVMHDTGHVFFVPHSKCRPMFVDLRGCAWYGGGGTEGQGDDSADPTGGGCGEPWPGQDNFPEGSEAGWTPFALREGVHQAAAPPVFSNAGFRINSDNLELKGAINGFISNDDNFLSGQSEPDDDAGGALGQIPEDARPQGSAYALAVTGSTGGDPAVFSPGGSCIIMIEWATGALKVFGHPAGDPANTLVLDGVKFGLGDSDPPTTQIAS